MSNEERYKAALEKIREYAGEDGSDNWHHVYDIANEALDPVELPEYEEVIIETWRVINQSGRYQTATSLEIAERLQKSNIGSRIVHLSGIDKRPIKPKVKRREEITGKYVVGYDFPSSTKYYAEWEE